MDIPPELKLKVLQQLEKKDIKAVRLVSKQWSICTPNSLFNRIYWSPQDPDLNVFHNIVSDPVLAGCVKELVFDGSQFGIGVTKRQYLDDLCLQIDELFDDVLLRSLPVDSGDPEVDTLANTIRTLTSTEEVVECYEELWSLCGKFKFVGEGYRKWRILAQHQLTKMGDARTSRCFSEGLTKLCKQITVTRVIFLGSLGSARLLFMNLTYYKLISHYEIQRLTFSYPRQPQICYVVPSVVLFSYHAR